MYYYDDINKLVRAGYKVTERSPWHYQVEHHGEICNIWPTKNKYMREFGDGASIYDDVVEAVASVVGPPGKRETMRERRDRLLDEWHKEYPVPQDPEADRVWREGLDKVVNEIHKLIAERRAMDF